MTRRRSQALWLRGVGTRDHGDMIGRVNWDRSVPTTYPHLAISRPIFSPPTCLQLSSMPQINNHKPEVFISEITVVGLNRKIDAFISTHWEDKAGCGLVLVADICTQRLSLSSRV